MVILELKIVISILLMTLKVDILVLLAYSTCWLPVCNLLFYPVEVIVEL